MSDRFYPLPLPQLVKLVLDQVRHDKLFDIPGTLFYRPAPGDPFGSVRYGRHLQTPLGIAAGPHTQLALNIIAAWLCGARYIELKTIQTLDELSVAKPCIDMQDEGYNCEWSQELKVQNAFREYLNAWIVIHILHRELGFTGSAGTLFNMSVGYDHNGIMQENVQWFLDTMRHCPGEVENAVHGLQQIYPGIRTMNIPGSISDHVTLSTMHGCPPAEIEKIGLYLIREKRLHTTIKLNPTLLGPGALRTILNETLGFPAIVPDEAFEHDLKYPDALRIIRILQEASAAEGLQFSVKLTNTLESRNHKDIFPSSETMMYMSGRALHPVSIALANKLRRDFGGTLDITFSAGADCFNIADVMACDLEPVTVCSDLLKPGGYGRLHQYIANLRKAYKEVDAADTAQFISARAGVSGDRSKAASVNLERYAGQVIHNRYYHKASIAEPSIKTDRELGWFDCIHAPCTDTCPTGQEIPEYMRHAASGNFNAAFDTVTRTNPFPSVTGMICDHLCQLKCTRINYDEALRIRDVKRFISGYPTPLHKTVTGEKSKRAAIIGAGPAGLTCGWFLRQAGMEVDIFEQREMAGGMVSAAIPVFRLTDTAIDQDIRRILGAGIRLFENHHIDKQRFEELRRDYDLIFLATGAQRSVRLAIPGIDSAGVGDPLEFLYAIRSGVEIDIGRHVLIIGGGNTAMDAARTAFRLVGSEGSVTILYRRTVKEMPADHGEITACRQEGIRILELVNPEEVIVSDGSVSGLHCTRNELAGKGSDGRPLPLKITGSDFIIPCDTIIPAIGQALAIDFLDPGDMKMQPGSYSTRIPGLFLGGDALRGASTAINAIGDGRMAAMEILSTTSAVLSAPGSGGNRTHREFGCHPLETSPDDRRNFSLVQSAYTKEDAMKEASRCLSCDEICNVCVSVCPNLANFSYHIQPVSLNLQKAVKQEDGTIVFTDDEVFNIDQPHQVLNIRDLCNECGNCTTFCPSSGRPFADKPGLSCSVESFNSEASGFYFSRVSGRSTLVYKEKDNFRTLTKHADHLEYETNQVRATIDSETFALLDVKFLAPCVREFRFGFAAGMAIVMQGAEQIITD